MLKAIQSIEASLPVSLKGFDSDNGSEFLNHHLLGYFNDKSVKFTRSRPYKKNDNAHVEQKNWTHVRQLLGYERLSHPRLVPLIHALYSQEVSCLRNHFIPTLKILKKERIGSKIIKRYDPPQTPYEKVLASPHVSKANKEQLGSLHKRLDPFELSQAIQAKLHKIYAQVDRSNRQKRRAI